MPDGYGLGYGQNVQPWGSPNAAQYLSSGQGGVLSTAVSSRASAIINGKPAQKLPTPITPPPSPPGMRSTEFYELEHQRPPIIGPLSPADPRDTGLWYGQEHTEAPLSAIGLGPGQVMPSSQKGPTRGKPGFEIPQDSVATVKLFDIEKQGPILAVIVAIILLAR